MKLKELYEKRLEIGKRIKEMAANANKEGRDWTAEDETNWTAANADYNAVLAQIEKGERAEEIEKTLAVEQATQTTSRNVEMSNDEARSVAFAGWARRQYGMDTDERHEQAAKQIGMRLDSREFVYRRNPGLVENRTTIGSMTVAAGDGGDTIPTGFVPRFERALLAYGGVRRVATVLTTMGEGQITWPTSNDTSNEAVLIAEATADSDQDMATSKMTLDSYKYTSKIVKVSAELLQDSAFDMAGIVGAALGERIGRGTNGYFTTGTGSSQPNGIVTAATTGVTTASATAIAANELVELVHSVDPAYREQGCAFMLHDSILLAIRKLKDDYGQYLWQPGLRNGAPDALLGYPLVINQKMASSIAASAKTVLFGLLSKYVIRDVGEIRFKRLVERYAEYDVDGFIALFRNDGDLLDAGTHPVKLLVQKSS